MESGWEPRDFVCTSCLMSSESPVVANAKIETWKIMDIDLQRMQVCADVAVESFRRFLQARFEHVFISVDQRDVFQREDEVIGEVLCLNADDRIEGSFTLSIGDLASGGDNILYFSEDLPNEDAFEYELAFLRALMREPAKGQLKLIFDCP